MSDLPFSNAALPVPRLASNTMASPALASVALASGALASGALASPGTLQSHYAVHPLDAPPEQKLFHRELGRMALTPRVKVALFILQGYLGIMALLVGWRLIAGT